MKIAKFASGKAELTLSKKEWLRIGKDNKWLDKYAGSLEESPLKGKSKQSAVRYIYNLVGDLTKGIFTDEYWNAVKAIWEKLDENGIDIIMTKTEYGQENGIPTRKEWHFYIDFINNRGKLNQIQGVLTAHGAGSIQDPLDKYDISFVIS